MSTSNFNLAKCKTILLFSEYVNGPMPLTGTFTSNGGNLLIFFSGSGYSSTPGKVIGAELHFNGNATPVATIKGSTNEANSHKSFVPCMIPYTPTVVSNTFEIKKLLPDTVSDVNDFYCLTIVEFN